MAQPTWPIYASLASQYVPLVAAAVRRRDITRPRLFVLLWVGIYVVVNLVGIILAKRHINNHFLPVIVTPLQGIVILWALSLWQTRQVARLTIRLAIPCFLVAWA